MKIMKFSKDVNTQRNVEKIDVFIKNVLFDEEPLFVSDEATVWDLTAAPFEVIASRCLAAYGKKVTKADLALPLWKFVVKLDE